MENASKAIVMAGGVLIAILTMSLLVIMFGQMNSIERVKEDEKDKKELQEWNAEWESYNKRIMYGADVITVLNKATEVNLQYINQPKYQITVKIEPNLTQTELEQNYKLAIFECTKMGYSNETGRVNKITFKFIRK